ncbi:hypothetical protein [Phaeospirillum tilakii]|uniref:VPLPA-CTERM protein sorting domain-containing protein n=1 Tax=Phaeospirillum tilakii TaxID=741673 RepID=A0ABW5CDE0_9PROT
MHVLYKAALAVVALVASSIVAPVASYANWNGYGDYVHLQGMSIGDPVTLRFGDYRSTLGGKYYNFDWSGIDGNVVRIPLTNNYTLKISGSNSISFSAGTKFGVSNFKYYTLLPIGEKIHITIYTDAAMKNAVEYVEKITWFKGNVDLAAITHGLSSSIYKIVISKSGGSALYVDNISTTVVPLPGALPLLGSALVLGGLLGRRLRRKAA